jgi:hypothetical protein
MRSAWTADDDLALIERAGTASILLSQDAELKERVRGFRRDLSSLILSSPVGFRLCYRDARLSDDTSNGNIVRVDVSRSEAVFVLGAEVKAKILAKKELGLLSSTLQRLFASWALFACCFGDERVRSSAFFFDFSDFAQHSAPCVCYCSNRANDCLVPDPFFLEDFGYQSLRKKLADQIPWKDRKSVIFWRGASSGIGVFAETDRVYYLRNLARLPLGVPVDAAFSRITPDVASTLGPEEEAKLREGRFVADPVPKTDFLNYKYLLDIDGNSNSWGGLYSNLLTGSLVVKCQSRKGFRQWYYPRLKSGENCVLLDADLGNWRDVRNVLHDDELAEDIGRNGRDFALGLNVAAELKDTRARLCDWLEIHGG